MAFISAGHRVPVGHDQFAALCKNSSRTQHRKRRIPRSTSISNVARVPAMACAGIRRCLLSHHPVRPCFVL